MYDKRTLKKLPVPKLPKARTEEIYSGDAVGYVVRSALAMDGTLLIVAFYDRQSAANGFSLPTAVLYSTKSEYTTMLTIEGLVCWRTGTIRYVLDAEHRYPAPKMVCLNHGDEDRIRKFLRGSKPSCHGHRDGIDYYITAYQHGLLKIHRERKWAKQKEEYDTLMNTVPPLPDDFYSWVDNVPWNKARFLFYERLNKRLSRAFCSQCHTDQLLDSMIPHHNKEGVCPQCGEAITYKAINRSTSLMYTANACIAQRTAQGGFVLRYFWLDRDFRERNWQPVTNYRHAEDCIKETARLFLNKEGQITGAYRHAYLNFLGADGFRRDKRDIFGEDRIYARSFMGMNGGWSINIWYRPAHVYPHNLRDILEQYSLPYALEQKIGEKQPLDITTYLCQHIRYPIVCSFDRLGLGSLGEDLLVNGNELKAYYPKGSLHRRLGLSKEQFAMAVENNFTTYHINLITSSTTQPTLDSLLWLGEHRISLKVINNILQYTTLHKARKYLQQQRKVVTDKWLFTNDSRSRECVLAGYWADYLEMSKSLEFQTKKWRILFPQNIKNQHDKVAALIKVKHDPVMDVKIKNRYPALDKKYSYENSQYILRPMRDFNDFMEEGAELMHCVASSGYFEFHVQGSSFIFMVRRQDDPDTAYYTMEFDPKKRKVLQLRGYKDCSPTEHVADFRDEWLEAMGYLKRNNKMKEAA